jgi:hypothetical protein
MLVDDHCGDGLVIDDQRFAILTPFHVLST